MARDARIAFGLNLVGLLRVRDAVAFEDSAAAADLRIAVKVELFFGVAFNAVGGHEASGVRVGVARDGSSVVTDSRDTTLPV